ncbi:MAG: hypothetical protein L3J56_00990 [Bacteroidales bacterium]|nr:hypothetical protein [Bacteroidales bacterium]
MSKNKIFFGIRISENSKNKLDILKETGGTTYAGIIEKGIDTLFERNEDIKIDIFRTETFIKKMQQKYYAKSKIAELSKAEEMFLKKIQNFLINLNTK